MRESGWGKKCAMTFEAALTEAKRRAEVLGKDYMVAYSDKFGGPDAYMVMVDDGRDLAEHVLPVEKVAMVVCDCCKQRVWKTHRCEYNNHI
jgi:hypothetical protein